MRILLLTHAYNGLTQRIHTELAAAGHELSIEFDISDSVTEEAVALYRPQLIVAPYLRRAIPESIWRRHVCLIVHPGIVGDRGPSALDWVVQEGAELHPEWGVTVLQAEAEMDAGPIWASETFAMRPGRKSSLYRHEVAAAAVRAVSTAVARFAAGGFVPVPLAQAGGTGRQRPPMRQADRAIDWRRDDAATVLRKLDAADGHPGVAGRLFGEPCQLYDGRAETVIAGGVPGEPIGRRETALLVATVDGAVWIGHVRREPSSRNQIPAIKLPATLAFAERVGALPELPLADCWAKPGTWQDIAYEETGDVGTLRFEFYNGAMSTGQCRRLQAACLWAARRPTRVLVLAGGADFWSNGIHLNVIEAAASPADESWRNIEAIDDLAETLIRMDSKLTVAALAGNAGAGGAYLARAADLVWVRDGVLLNPHYKNMGNLYGSEYWTYLLPPRVGLDAARAIMNNRLPLSAAAALACGLTDARLAGEPEAFGREVGRRARELAAADDHGRRLEAKRARRASDEAAKPLAQYRAEELAHMKRNFYGFDPSYHVARYHFVNKSPASWTPRHLARHRDLGWRVPA